VRRNIFLSGLCFLCIMIEKEKEIWKDVLCYENYYQVSNMGRVRSLDRTVIYKDGRKRFYKGKMLSPRMRDGYKYVTLTMRDRKKTFKFSQLVAMAFLGHKPNGNTLVVDHINGNRSDDRVDNLRVVTNRANTTTCFRSDNGTFSSEYVGVHWDIKSLKWRSSIHYDGINIHLGLFDNEADASNAYQKALSKIENGSFNPNDYKPKCSSKYKGVDFHKASNKWRARIAMKGSQKFLGSFKTEIEASNAYQKALKEYNL
jgi:hypothetical protein